MKNTEEILEESRQNTMARLNDIVAAYYQKYAQAGENQHLTINHIEEFLIDCKEDIDKVLKEASTDIIDKMEDSVFEKKTSVPGAEEK